MGGNSGKVSTHNQDLPGSSLQELPSYDGYPIEYHYINVNAELDTQCHFSFMEPNMTIQATNVEQYCSQLAALYNQGCKLLVFVSHPGSIKKYDWSSNGHSKIDIRFQGIFRKLLPEEKKTWELQVVKSALSNQMFQKWSGDLLLNAGAHTGSITGATFCNAGSSYNGSMTDSYHIFETLRTIAHEGGRLISVELTGMSREDLEMQKQYIERQAKMHHAATGSMPDMQVAVDVFFEVPRQPCSEKYAYKAVRYPMESTYHHAFPRGHFSSKIDWQNARSQYLGTGWKLVEILEDYSVSNLIQMSGIRVNCNQVKNCLWIFEKPLSRMDDDRSYYELKIVDHWIRSQTHGHNSGHGEASSNIATDWEPVLEHFGKVGWEVVKILETPDTRFEGTFQPIANTRLMIFLQRLIATRSGGVIIEQKKTQSGASKIISDEKTSK